MAKPADATVAQCGMALALREKPCPNCNGTGILEKHYVDEIAQHECKSCRGTGQVAKYPTLRVEKQGIWSHHDCISMGRCQNILYDGTTPVHATDCQGRGWLPVTTERALWEAVWTIAHHVEVDSETGREGGPIDIWLTLEGQTGDEDDLPWGEGKTVAEALARALCAAEGIEEVANAP